jgi:hypothetical protein
MATKNLTIWPGVPCLLSEYFYVNSITARPTVNTVSHVAPGDDHMFPGPFHLDMIPKWGLQTPEQFQQKICFEKFSGSYL